MNNKGITVIKSGMNNLEALDRHFTVVSDSSNASGFLLVVWLKLVHDLIEIQQFPLSHNENGWCLQRLFVV